MTEPLSPSPEIRHLLRKAHHVTCGGFNGKACTCLEWREKLIAELAQPLDLARRAGWENAADFAECFGCTMEIVPGETKANHLQRFMEKLVAAMRTKKGRPE